MVYPTSGLERGVTWGTPTRNENNCGRKWYYLQVLYFSERRQKFQKYSVKFVLNGQCSKKFIKKSLAFLEKVHIFLHYGPNAQMFARMPLTLPCLVEIIRNMLFFLEFQLKLSSSILS